MGNGIGGLRAFKVEGPTGGGPSGEAYANEAPAKVAPYSSLLCGVFRADNCRILPPPFPSHSLRLTPPGTVSAQNATG